MENQGLLAPESYWKLSNDEKYEITNGCGPARATNLIPDSVFGVDLAKACDIHDYTYTRPETMMDRADADDLFLVNMHRAVAQSLRSPFLQVMAFFAVNLYYLTVRLFGRRYFQS